MPNLLTMLPQGPYAIYGEAADTILLRLASLNLHVHQAEYDAAKAAGRIAPVGFAASVAVPVHGEDGKGGSVAQPQGDGTQPRRAYPVSGGVGILKLSGPMQKDAAPSMEDGTSTVALRRQVRQARADTGVKAVALHISSPGGTVEGTDDLAADVRALATEKPTYAYIEDMGASAAYWIASQCNQIYGNPSAMVGSIGVRAPIFDTSKALNDAGVTAHWLVSGEHKATGALGLPVTEEQVAVMQSLIDAFAAQFVSAVNRGRAAATGTDPSIKIGSEPADGRMYVGAAARRAGLIDGVTTFDKMLSTLKSGKAA